MIQVEGVTAKQKREGCQSEAVVVSGVRVVGRTHGLRLEERLSCLHPTVARHGERHDPHEALETAR